MALTWLAGNFIQALAVKAFEVASDRFVQQEQISDVIWRLQMSLSKVQTVLKLAEDRQKPKDCTQLEWLLNELKLVAYEADDLLDDINYDILKQKVEHGEEEESAGNLSLVSSTATRFKNLFRIGNNVGKQAAEIQNKLDTLAAHLKDVLELLPFKNEKKRKLYVTPSRETASYSSETILFGRDEDLEQLVQLLTEGSGTSDDNFSVMTLYGMGGVGKTTLAQFVYNDKRVQKYFELKAWVCVSDCFDERRITKEIIESITKVAQSDINLNILQSALKEKIMSKKVLIVLDDVWNEDSNRWERLFAPLVYTSPGSKILLTARTEIVADKAGSRNKIHLMGLEDDDFWQLFEKCALGTFGFEQNQNLIPLGRRIVTKLKGSPLAAKTVGSILKSDLSEEHWRDIMQSKLWELQQNDTDILAALQLSYEYLHPHLKQCFSYCSLFPKDRLIEKEKLVYMWMSHGLILPQSNMQSEDVGISYIDDLISRCLFEEVSDYDCCIKMHDLIHDLAEFVSKGENFMIDNCLTSLSQSVTNLSINSDNLKSSNVNDICNKNDKLRTLMILHGYRLHISSAFLDCMLTSFRSLRMLSLESCGINEVPNSIGNLKHLRYCDISYNQIKSLPEAICSLYNLQYLYILGLPLDSSPKGMCNLINLRNLKADKEFVIYKIDNFGKMTSLQELNEFNVNNEQGQRISELKNLRQLRKTLHLKGLEVIGNKEEASEAKLNEKEYLDELILEWPDSNPRNNNNDAEVIEGLQPHCSTKELSIIYYGGVRSPSWLDQLEWSRIHKLYLYGCCYWEEINFIGQLPCLKFLEIVEMSAVKTISHGLRGEFLELEEIGIYDMPEWEDWIVPNGNKSFPRLRRVDVWKCPKLKVIPLFEECEISNQECFRLPSLERLGIWGGPNVKPVLQNFLLPPSMKELHLYDHHQRTAIKGCSLQSVTSMAELTINPHVDHHQQENSDDHLFLPPSIRQLNLDCKVDDHFCDSNIRHLHNLKFVSTLCIEGCSGINSLPMHLLCNLTGLEHLGIYSCRGLASIEGLQVATSLKKLWISKCPKLINREEESVTHDLPSSSLLLEELLIDDTRMLKLQPLLTTLHSIQKLRIVDSEEVVMFEDVELLRSLTSLKDLKMRSCVNVESMPVESMPTSLASVYLNNCSEKLKQLMMSYKQHKHNIGEPFHLGIH